MLYAAELFEAQLLRQGLVVASLVGWSDLGLSCYVLRSYVPRILFFPIPTSPRWMLTYKCIVIDCLQQMFLNPSSHHIYHVCKDYYSPNQNVQLLRYSTPAQWGPSCSSIFPFVAVTAGPERGTHGNRQINSACPG